MAATVTGDQLAGLELGNGRFVRLNAGFHRDRVLAAGSLTT